MNHVALVALAAAGLFSAGAVRGAEPNLAHMVYFKLKESSPEARQKLVAACQKYLSGHEGTVYFSAGVLAEEFDREVNDRDFDVGLHLVFANKAAHDAYQVSERHLKFIDENRATWEKVRVFDSYVATEKQVPPAVRDLK